MARCRHCGRHGLAEGPAGPGSTAPSPDEGGGGLALVQLLPAAAPASRHRHRHRRALLGQCRLSSSPWPATAGRAPPPAARCRAPGTAGRRGCRTAVRGRGRPDSASRRSGGCTDGVVGLGPARAAAGLVQPRAGRDGDLPGPAHLPAAHEASPPLAWLPGSDQPTKPAGTAKPEPHRGSTVLPAGRACRARSGCGPWPEGDAGRVLHRAKGPRGNSWCWAMRGRAPRATDLVVGGADAAVRRNCSTSNTVSALSTTSGATGRSSAAGPPDIPTGVALTSSCGRLEPPSARQA
jgi:hypothetical protein